MAQIDLGKVVGRSAYEIAVQNGFEGTEQEWLDSLRGQNGEPGQDAESYQVLASKEEVQENMEAGRLVDALVVKEVFQSVSEGKEVIASAITDKGIQTDAGDTFAVMAENIGQIQGGGGGSGDTSPHIYPLRYQGAFSNKGGLDIRSSFAEKGVKKIVLKNIYIAGRKAASNASSSYITFILKAKKDGVSQNVYSFTSAVILNTDYTNITKEHIEIDMTEYDEIEYMGFYTSRQGGTIYYYEFTITGEIEIYF